MEEELEAIKADIEQIKNIIKQIYNHLENNKLEKWEGIDDIETCNIGDCENVFNLIECKSCMKMHCKECKKNQEIECCNCGFTSCHRIVEPVYKSDIFDGDDRWIHYGSRYLCWRCRDATPTFLAT